MSTKTVKRFKALNPHKVLGYRTADAPLCLACWTGRHGRIFDARTDEKLTPFTLHHEQYVACFNCQAVIWPLPQSRCRTCHGPVVQVGGRVVSPFEQSIRRKISRLQVRTYLTEPKKKEGK